MDEINKIAPNLSTIKKEKAFGTPKNYFDDFPARMQMQIEAEKHGTDKNEFKIIRLLKPALGLAASFAIIFMLVYMPLKRFAMQNQVSETTAAADYYTNEIQTFLQEMDESSFLGLLESEPNEDTFSDEDLIAYLSDNFSSYEIFEYTKE